MRDVQKSILRPGPSPGDAEQQQQHPHYKSKQLSPFSLQLWHCGSFGGFISIRAHLHPEWQSSVLPEALQRKGCSYIGNRQEEKKKAIFFMVADTYSWNFAIFVAFMKTAFRSCHLVGLLETNQLTESPLEWQCLHLNIKHQGQSS